MSKKYSITTYRNLIKEDIYLKGIIDIGYSFKHKGAVYSWAKLTKKKINSCNIKKRPCFYSDKRIPKEYRSYVSDYLNSGYDRGHLISDASFDNNIENLKAVYKLSNIVPQKPHLNRYVWKGIERYSRYVTMVLGYTYVINIMLYKDEKIGNGISVPFIMYKLIMNNKHGFLKVFRVRQDNITKGLKYYLSDAKTLKKDIKKYKG